MEVLSVIAVQVGPAPALLGWGAGSSASWGRLSHQRDPPAYVQHSRRVWQDAQGHPGPPTYSLPRRVEMDTDNRPGLEDPGRAGVFTRGGVLEEEATRNLAL